MSISPWILGSFGLLLALPPTLADAQDPPETSATSEPPRVRSSDGRLTALIKEATQRSATFRALIASINASDGIVFVEAGRCPRGVPACLTAHVTLAGSHRILFVLLDTRKSDLDLMASAGHELQHALEVLAVPALRSTAAVQLFYRRGMSPESPPTVETMAATVTGNAVWREVRRSRARESK